MVYACMQANKLAVAVAAAECISSVQFCSLSVDCHADSLTHMVCVVHFFVFFSRIFITVVWHCRLNHNEQHTNVVILFIYHLSGSGVPHLNIYHAGCIPFFPFCSFLLVRLLELLWFHKTTTQMQTQMQMHDNENGKHLRLPISITNGNYLQTGIMRVCVCLCAHTKQRKLFKLQLWQKKCARQKYEAWFHANAKIQWTTVKMCIA